MMLFKLQRLWLKALDEVEWVGRNVKRGDHDLFQGIILAFSWGLRKTMKNLMIAGNKVVSG
jgi:hypothetical protein